MTPVAPPVGEELADYRLDEILGRGAMSVVYRAEHPRLGSAVALKVLAHELATEELFRLRFLHVSRLAASVSHPNVIPIFDAGPWGDMLFVAMRYVPGPDLGRLLKDEGRLNPDRALAIVGQAGRALDAAHGHDLVHRDVTPSNILIEPGEDGDPEHVYVADFGITKRALAPTGLTATGEFFGTVDYIAPEQIQGERVDGRTDIYSLGCVLYHCLTGRVPFQNSVDSAVLWAHLEDQPPAPSSIRPELSPEVDEVIARAMAKSPGDRYRSCRELVSAAAAALDGQAGRAFVPDAGSARHESLPPVVQESEQPVVDDAFRPGVDEPAEPVAGEPVVADKESEGEPPGDNGHVLSHPSTAVSSRPDRNELPPVRELAPARFVATRPPARSATGSRRGGPPVRGRGRRSGGGSRRRWVWLGLAGVAALLIAVLLVNLLSGGNSKNGSTRAAVSGPGTPNSTMSRGMNSATTGGSAGAHGGTESTANGSSTSSSSSSSNSMNGMPASNAITKALNATNHSDTAKHLLPPSSCKATGAHTATCMKPAFGADEVTFHTYPSIGALYAAYESDVKQLNSGSMRTNFGDCTEKQTYGEVSWNHDYKHPRHYSFMDARMGKLTDDQAAGRVFCSFTNSLLYIIWTQNDGHLLGILSGAPHANTWDWWKGVHHSIAMPGSAMPMKMH